MVTRTKTTDLGYYPRGTVSTPGGGVYTGGNARRLFMSVTSDSNKNIRDKPYNSSIIACSLNPISGSVERVANPGVVHRQIDNLAWSPLQGLFLTAITRPEADSFLVPSVLARSNPSQAKVDVPVFLGELRDVPHMFLDIFRAMSRITKSSSSRRLTTRERLNHAAKQAALEVFPQGDKWFIANQFGWEPLVSDIEDFFKLGNAIDQRAKQLANLKEFGSTSRNVVLESYSTATPPYKRLVHTAGIFCYAMCSSSRTYRKWGSARWELDSDGPLARTKDLDDVRRLATSAIRGMTVDAHTAWSLTPWSWLIDWASNAGDWIESSRNVVGASPKGKVCIMRERTISINEDSAGPDPLAFKLSGQTGTLKGFYRNRQRTVHSPFNIPAFRMPILTNRQSAILGALATMRAKGQSTYVARF